MLIRLRLFQHSNHLPIASIILVFLVFGHGIAPAQTTDPSRLTLERIFASNEFQPARFGGFRWLKDGDSYAKLEPSPTIKGAMDLVSYRIDNEKREVLIPAEKLI